MAWVSCALEQLGRGRARGGQTSEELESHVRGREQDAHLHQRLLRAGGKVPKYSQSSRRAIGMVLRFGTSYLPVEGLILPVS